MVQYMRRNAERQANMFVVSASTPAQLFHALRRQMNRPFLKCAGLLRHMSMSLVLRDWALQQHPCHRLCVNSTGWLWACASLVSQFHRATGRWCC